MDFIKSESSVNHVTAEGKTLLMVYISLVPNEKFRMATVLKMFEQGFCLHNYVQPYSNATALLYAGWH